MPLSIKVGNIAAVTGVEVIVNAANRRLKYGHGVCGAIFDAAGVPEMSAACEQIGSCPTGKAVYTPSFNLRSNGILYVIHTVGPIYPEHSPNEAASLLFDAYMSVFTLLESLKCTSIALPAISTGIYGYPLNEGIQIALFAATLFLRRRPEMNIQFVAFTPDLALKFEKVLGNIQELAQ